MRTPSALTTTGARIQTRTETDGSRQPTCFKPPCQTLPGCQVGHKQSPVPLGMLLLRKPVASAHSRPRKPETNSKELTTVTLSKDSPSAREADKAPTCHLVSLTLYLRGHPGWVSSWRPWGRRGRSSFRTTLSAAGVPGAAGSQPRAPSPAGTSTQQGRAWGAGMEGVTRQGHSEPKPHMDQRPTVWQSAAGT